MNLPPSPPPPRQNFVEEIQSDDDVEPSEVPHRQPEQRWSLVEDGAERPQEVDTEKRKQAWGEVTRLSNQILRIEKGVT